MFEPFFDPDIKYSVTKNATNISLIVINEDFQNFNSAVQGMVIFDTWTNSCPLESVSRDEPFQIKDETQIIYIQSSFYKSKFRRLPCKWRFSAPNNEYGFKIVIKKLHISNSTELIFKNSTTIFLKSVF